jgi:signal transduction histidine kinase
MRPESMPRSSVYLRYGWAVFSVFMATVITRLLWELDPEIGPLYFVAVMFSTWYGGLGPGLVATALAGSASAYFFADPPWSLAIGLDDWLRLFVFIAEALVINYLANSSRRARLAAEVAQGEAESANQAKDQFLSILSHELRMPLNPVLTAASALSRDTGLPQEVRQDMRMIQRNVELEARLIDDLLDLSRLSQGKLHIDMQPADCHQLLDQVKLICDEDIRNKQLRFALDAGAANPWVAGDPARLQQVLWNLIRNAAKFTPPGGSITVRTWNARAADGGRDELVVEVGDDGIGIEAGAIGRIFNAFEQADPAITRRFGGLGLGLAICQSLVSLHAGSISARSDGPGKGAVFTLRMPSTVPAVEAAPKTALDEAPGAGLRILLVEDQQDSVRLLARLLRSARHTVDTAETVAAAIGSASRNEYDLVISDLGLPDGSGLDLMQQLRERHNLKGIALTGYGTEEDIRRTRAAGFCQHLTKPVDIDQLEQAIRASV